MGEDSRQDDQRDRLGADKIEQDRAQRGETEPTPRPSQAEGDPETIDASLRQKEAEGEL